MNTNLLEKHMDDKRRIRGIASTTHIDRHGERLSKEALEDMAQNLSDQAKLIYWNHETTLPPIAMLTNEWVEKREDGEYQLAFEGYFLSNEDIEFLPQSNIEGLDITWEQVTEILNAIPPSPSGHIGISYDPRNFDPEEVTPIIEEMNELVETHQDLYSRKAELPQAVIWILVGFAGGHIASGFFTRLGEMAAEKVVETTKDFYRQLSNRLTKLLEKAKPEDSQPDVIFRLVVPESDTVIEGALESADQISIERVLGKLPVLYAIVVHLLQQNPSDFFSIMRFLYNPTDDNWEINYLVTRKTNKVIKGPRYYDRKHPLRPRYEKALEEIAEQGD
jgi:hypothetical protein